MGSNTGNYSRNMFDEQKQYIARRVQQGIPWVDADDNDAEQSNFRQHRRIEEILGDGAIGDGFKCVGRGWNNDFEILGGDGTDDGAGRYFLNGHDCMLKDATSYKNVGATESGRSVHPRVTAIAYQAGPNTTLITDSAANWAVNEHAGKLVTPDITQPGSSFLVVSNTNRQLTVNGDATVVSQIGDNYRIEMKTPIGSDRNDGVFLNVYLDEYDCVDDPNLIHNLNTATCAQLRTKLIQTVYIQQGAETFADYVDGDGNQHYVFQIARIHRYDGVDAIWDIDDLRKILNNGYIDYATLQLQGSNLRVVPSLVPADTVDVLPGWWTVSDRSAVKKLPARSTSPVFTPVTGAGKTRYDMVMIDDSGTINVKQGAEVAGTGDPFDDAPAPELNQLTLGIVRVDEVGAVVVNLEDVTDAREFLNLGAPGGGGGVDPGLAVIPTTPTSMKVIVKPGWYIRSDGLRVLQLAVDTQSPEFDGVLTPGNVRYDLLQIDDSKNLQIKQGTEIAGPGDPYLNSPDIDSNKMTLAIIKVTDVAIPAVPYNLNGGLVQLFSGSPVGYVAVAGLTATTGIVVFTVPSLPQIRAAVFTLAGNLVTVLGNQLAIANKDTNLMSITRLSNTQAVVVFKKLGLNNGSTGSNAGSAYCLTLTPGGPTDVVAGPENEFQAANCSVLGEGLCVSRLDDTHAIVIYGYNTYIDAVRTSLFSKSFEIAGDVISAGASVTIRDGGAAPLGWASVTHAKVVGLSSTEAVAAYNDYGDTSGQRPKCCYVTRLGSILTAVNTVEWFSQTSLYSRIVAMSPNTVVVTSHQSGAVHYARCLKISGGSFTMGGLVTTTNIIDTEPEGLVNFDSQHLIGYSTGAGGSHSFALNGTTLTVSPTIWPINYGAMASKSAITRMDNTHIVNAYVDGSNFGKIAGITGYV